MEPEPVADQPQPTIPSTPPVSPVVPSSKPKSRSMLLVGGIVILGIGFTIGLFFDKNPYLTSQISPTPTPSPAEVSTKEGDPTANWKTYTNSDFSFSFQYSPSFGNQGLIAGPFTGRSEFLQSFSNPLTIREGTDAPFDGFSLYVVMDMNTDSFDQYLRNELKIMNENEFSRMQGARQQSFSGGTALVTNTQGYYYLPTPDKQKLVVFVYLQANASFKPTFDQILSTFKFVDRSSSVLKWQGYDYLENEVYTTNNWLDFQGKKGNIHYIFNFPWNWEKTNSVFLDENGAKVAELSPGGVEMKPGQTCFDKSDVSTTESRVKIISTIPITVNELTGVLQVREVQYEGGGGGKYTGTWYPNVYCLQKGDEAFVMTFYETSPNSGKQSLFEEILATFDFVN